MTTGTVICLCIGCILGGAFIGSAITFTAMAICIVAGDKENEIRNT